MKVVRGDVTQFDDVIGAVQESRAERLINLSYFIGELAPHVAFKLDIQGMDNCFEAARRCGVKHTVFASSVAVSGQQAHFGERLVDETDERRGETQYAVNKIINEWQAHDYRRAYGMTITCIRPANVTGPDKKFGSIDHVNCMCQPARGQSVDLPSRRCDALRDPRRGHGGGIRARAARRQAEAHDLQFRRGTRSASASWQASVREFLPDADIRFEAETGGRAISGNFLIDNRRLIEEFGLQYKPLRQRVKEVINDIRVGEGLPPVA